MKKADVSDLEAVKNALVEGVNDTVLAELKMAEMLGWRIRYLTSGAVIGRQAFVNEVFTVARERFCSRRKDRAGAMKENAQAARWQLWSIRDLKV